MATAETRICKTCGIEKPYFPPHFRLHRRNCGDCERAAKRAHHHTLDPQKIREYLRTYRANNKEKVREWDRKKYVKHIERVRAYTKTRYDQRDKDRVAADHREWRKKNPDKLARYTRSYYEKNKDKSRAKARKWAKLNPEAEAARKAKRRAASTASTVNFTKDDVRQILRANGRQCFYCGCALKKFHVDHFIPLVKGGSNGPENIRLSCESCNCSKGAKMPWEWMPSRFAPIENGAG